MKQLITMAACLMVLMALLSQFVQNQQLLMKVESGTYAVDIFCRDKDEDRLRDSLSHIFECKKEDVLIKKEKNLLSITTPVKEILAVPEFWGIVQSQNHGVYRWERTLEDG